MRVLSQIISYLFHPMLLFFYVICLGYLVHPYSFDFEQERGLGLFFILSFLLLVGFPLLSALLMQRLQLTKSIEMHARQERIGPLIAALIFYIWYFINIKNDVSIPNHIVFLALGGTIALSIAFFINNFTKISLHAIGAGAMLMGTVILIMGYGYSSMTFSAGSTLYTLGPYALLAISLLIAGSIGSARLILGAHTHQDVYGGYLSGIIAMLVAYRISTFISF